MSTSLTTLVAPAMGIATEKQCPMCWGEGFLQDGSGAHDRIQELEGQVHALTARASATASKLREYEDEQLFTRETPSQIDQSPQRPTTSDSQPQTYHSRLTNLASLLPYRRGSATPASAPTTSSGLPSTPTAPTTPIPHMSPANSEHTAELQDALTREQRLRKAAELQLSQASTELEELTVQLFSQANEMVAEERRARAKLEERVAVLERRDVEKRSRLEKLEKAMARVERLRALVNHQS
ncbi:GDPGTP exchange factor Sec2p [Penicillium coprophilum]|uniref:GDPGTP exchange factor Sec2p n=1 Tax=Penicillium coprophilum TaxID=36646 RepID=UPI00239EC212|nr:GDPGTP exchange factor Sec2p [Penicillium coprophilum]KAJ5178381.1 GDPGTP exchange factor Sec2p [Penicillium coprophilum]